MGKYRIRINGTGQHHTGDTIYDADLLAKDLVATLRAKGHTISLAEFQELDFEGKPARRQDEKIEVIEYIVPPENL